MKMTISGFVPMSTCSMGGSGSDIAGGSRPELTPDPTVRHQQMGGMVGDTRQQGGQSDATPPPSVQKDFPPGDPLL